MIYIKTPLDTHSPIITSEVCVIAIQKVRFMTTKMFWPWYETKYYLINVTTLHNIQENIDI